MLIAHAHGAPRDNRRFRLAGNDNEILVNSMRRSPSSNIDADDDLDTEGHRLATNDNETVVDGARRATPADEGDEPPLYPSGRRR